jgi:hypothetical protein
MTVQQQLKQQQQPTDHWEGNDNYDNYCQQQQQQKQQQRTTTARTMIVLSACAFQCFTISAWNAIDVLTSESFPTWVRATGMGVCSATGAMIAQFVNGWLIASPKLQLLVAAGMILLGAIRTDVPFQPIRPDNRSKIAR